MAGPPACTGFSTCGLSKGLSRGAANGQDVRGIGGPVAAAERVVQACCQGHWSGRCSTKCRAREAIRAGTLMMRRRRVAHRAVDMAAATAAVRAMLNAVTASAAQAAFAG